jgi:Putative prokaryotic signal transducing protein
MRRELIHTRAQSLPHLLRNDARAGEPHVPRAVQYPRAMEPGDAVVLTVVSGEPEAEVVCGLLRSAGIDCAYRDTPAIDSSLEDFTAAGPREILVPAADLDAARALLDSP